MSEYERFFRRRFSRLYQVACEALGDEEAAALAAQALCLEEFRALGEREAETFGPNPARLAVA